MKKKTVLFYHQQRCIVRTILFLLAGMASMVRSDMNEMNHGPFVSWTVGTEPLTYKGVSVKVHSDPPAVVLYDTDLMRVSAAWTGGFLKWYPQRDGLERWPTPDGSYQFVNDAGPGWSHSGSFADPRPLPYGPLPGAWARHQGMYLHGDKVVFAYTVGQCNVLESPGFTRLQGQPVFTRTFRLTPSSDVLFLRVLRVQGGKAQLQQHRLSDAKGYLQLQSEEGERFIGIEGVFPDVRWRMVEGHLCLELSPMTEPVRFRLAIATFNAGAQFADAFKEHLKGTEEIPDLGVLRQPGPPRWLPIVETKAAMGKEDGPFAVDALTLPQTNPWNSWIRPTGLDFLSDKRAVVSSVSGDVWLVSGVREQLDKLTWKRFATGLNQPLGVKIVEDQIYVVGRDQITILHDYNNDGEADFYENFNNEVMAAENFHEFNMNLETDSEGNFYFGKGTPWPPIQDGRLVPFTPHNGVLFQLSPDGRDLEIYATGLRYPNGLAVSPKDEILFSDNEGNWIPTSVLHRARRGAVYSFKPSMHASEPPEKFEPPIAWIPHAVDNSPGSPIWVTSKQWGPLQGRVLLTSYGKATLSLVLKETTDRVEQGGILNLPLRFQSGIMRGRFHSDGHLYVCGMRAWQTAGVRSGAFHRVRYLGGPLYLPLELNVKSNGLQLSFSDKLDPEEATNIQNYSIEQWNYRWIERYGSPHYSVKNPDREGSDTMEIRAVHLASDGKTVFLEIPEIQPVMQMRVAYILRSADGKELRHQIYNTIHRVPTESQ